MASSCISLQGSTLCPSFQNLYINAQNLTGSWPFFATVTDVSSFDTAFAEYIAPGGQFAKTKQLTQLGCTDYASANFILQYSQTFLCGEFTGISYSQACNVNIADTMTCQTTCIQFANSEKALVNDSTAACSTTSSTQAATLTKDFTQCTDWTSLATNNTATCVQGMVNEPNCGFGSSTTQLCAYCNPATALVDPCCVGTNVNTTASCGFTVAAAQVSGAVSSALPSSTSAVRSSSSSSSAAAPTSTTSSTRASLSSSAAGAAATAGGATAGTQVSHAKKLSGGAIAGIVIGALVGLALLAILLLLCCRRKRAGASSYPPESPGMTTSGTPTTYNEKKNSPVSTFQSPPTPTEKQYGGHGYMGAAGAGAALLPAAAMIGADSIAPNSRPISGATQLTNATEATDSSGNDGRVLIGSFQDLYSPAQITPESQVEAIYAYNPTLSDELQLSPGDTVTVHKLFDDNWANGTIEDADGKRRNGAFPLVCVTAARGFDSSTSRGSFEASQYQTGEESHASDADEDVRGDATSFHTATGGATTEGARPTSSQGFTGSVKEIFPRRPQQ